MATQLHLKIPNNFVIYTVLLKLPNYICRFTIIYLHAPQLCSTDSPLISDLNSKINNPGQATNKILKTNNYNQLFNSNCQLPKPTPTSTPTRPVENALMTKGLQERNTTVGRDDGRKIGKIIN